MLIGFLTQILVPPVVKKISDGGPMGACRPFAYRMHGAAYQSSAPLMLQVRSRGDNVNLFDEHFDGILSSCRFGTQRSHDRIVRSFTFSRHTHFLITWHPHPLGPSLHLQSLFTLPQLVATRAVIGTPTGTLLIACPRRESQAYCFMTNENQMSFGACFSL